MKVYQYTGVHFFASILILFNDVFSVFEGSASYMNSLVAFIFLLTITNILFIMDTTLGSLIISHSIVLDENLSK
jgi:hypothetical protein